jgi:ATP-binding cassette, subfamily B, multidrug efflux pump
LVSVGALAVWLWARGAVSLGDIAVATGLALRVTIMSGWVMWTSIGIFDNIGQVQEGMRTIARPRALVDRVDARPLTASKGAIRFENVRLRQQIGMVTQDTSLLHRSIVENIRYGRPDATDEAVIAAARQAHAHDFVMGLIDPDGRKGYDTLVGERGVKLSGGQRQRIAIARVLLKNAPILVLDEATSALDSEVEAAIQENFQTLMEGKTVIAIAHRLSTIAAMDRLIVLERGQIAETGMHQELLKRGGIYAALWRRQCGGFLDARAA